MNNFTMVPQNRETGKENREITLSLMLGETKSEYPKWRRELEYKASLAGLTQMINEPRKILLTREQWGAPQNPKAGVEHSAYVKTELQDAVRACELIRKGLTNYSTADIIARNDLDNVRPHEAITKIAEHFNKPDVGMLVDKVAALFAPSVEVTTQGVFNESMQMLAEIEPLLRQPIAAAAASQQQKSQREQCSSTATGTYAVPSSVQGRSSPMSNNGQCGASARSHRNVFINCAGYRSTIFKHVST
jgi:hypothetical protein